MPALSQARERGKSAQCLNNLKQSALSVISYTEDHKCLQMYSERATGDKQSYLKWKAFVCREIMQRNHKSSYEAKLGGNYLADPDQALCPAVFPYQQRWKAFKGHDGKETNDYKTHISSYSTYCAYSAVATSYGEREKRTVFQARFADADATTTNSMIFRPVFIKSPSQFILFADGWSKSQKAQWYWLGNTSTNPFAAHHNSKCNIAWADGHADSNGAGDIAARFNNLSGKSGFYLPMDDAYLTF